MRGPGSCLAYLEIVENVQSIAEKYPSIFQVGTQQISEAFPKEIYWFYVKRGYIKQALIDDNVPGAEDFKIVPLSNWFVILLKRAPPIFTHVTSFRCA